MRITTRPLTILALAAALPAQFAAQAGSAAEVALRTPYLQQPIDEYHRIELTGELGGTARLLLDPNTCRLNLFGDPGGCTRIATTSREVRLVEVEVLDPTGQGRTVYEIEGAGLEQPLRLVAAADPACGSRLTYGKGEQEARRVVTLESAGKPGPSNGGHGGDVVTGSADTLSFDEALADAVGKFPKPDGADRIQAFEVLKVAGRVGGIADIKELSVTVRVTTEGDEDGSTGAATEGGQGERPCEGDPGRAAYAAVQIHGKVYLFGVGVHPTAGHRACFEELPIEIFPPQFRLRVTPPDGMSPQVLTPFSVHTTFAAGRPVRELTVHDAEGQHVVPVVALPRNSDGE